MGIHSAATAKRGALFPFVWNVAGGAVSPPQISSAYNSAGRHALSDYSPTMHCCALCCCCEENVLQTSQKSRESRKSRRSDVKNINHPAAEMEFNGLSS